MSVMAAYLTEVGSAYINDSRVSWLDDGVLIGDPYDSGLDRAVAADGGGFVVLGVYSDDATLYDEAAWYASRSRVPKVYATLDNAIHAVLGDPR